MVNHNLMLSASLLLLSIKQLSLMLNRGFKGLGTCLVIEFQSGQLGVLDHNLGKLMHTIQFKMNIYTILDKRDHAYEYIHTKDRKYDAYIQEVGNIMHVPRKQQSYLPIHAIHLKNVDKLYSIFYLDCCIPFC